MLTTDLALKLDPIYGPISKRFYENPDQLAEAFAKAWYKLLHRDMGPVSRYLGPRVAEPQLWQDPVPEVDHELITDEDIAALKDKILESELSISQLQTLEQIQRDFNSTQSGGTKVSLADLIVLGGCTAVEQAAKNAGHDITVQFAPGRTDASQEQTDVESFAVLEPTADGFRNHLRAGEKFSPEALLVDRAFMLTLTAPEMTVLIGGMPALNANLGRAQHGVLTDRPEALTNDFFVNLLDMSTEWKATASAENVYEGRDRATGDLKWTATAVDLVLGSNSQLRASRRFTHATTRGRSSWVTSWPRGTRS
jgi:catalase-peroxidase